MPDSQGWKWSDVWEEVQKGHKPAAPRPRDASGARVPTEQERDDWINSMPQGVRPEDIREHIKSQSPVKWAALQVLFKWAGSELKKLGMNPDDARWYL